jgi:hypothetical protein
MLNLTIPLIAATVFTVGGYGILNAKRHVERIEELLIVVFMMCALLAMIGMTAIFAARLTPRPMPAAMAQAKPVPTVGSIADAHAIVWTGN